MSDLKDRLEEARERVQDALCALVDVDQCILDSRATDQLRGSLNRLGEVDEWLRQRIAGDEDFAAGVV